MQHLNDDRCKPLRSYLASSGGVPKQFGQCAEAGIENLRLEPGQQLRVAMRLAEQTAIRVALDPCSRLAHVDGQPDQVVAQNAGPLVYAGVPTQLVERVDHHRRRVRPPPVQRALTGARPFGNAVEGKPPESNLG